MAEFVNPFRDAAWVADSLFGDDAGESTGRIGNLAVHEIARVAVVAAADKYATTGEVVGLPKVSTNLHHLVPQPVFGQLCLILTQGVDTGFRRPVDGQLSQRAVGHITCQNGDGLALHAFWEHFSRTGNGADFAPEPA